MTQDESKDYFEDYPPGDPKASDCRGCGMPKLEHRGARVCPKCDGPAMLQRPVQA